MKTTSFKTIIILFAVTIITMSCEKEIKIKHNSKNAKLVVEAEFDSASRENSVKISKTISVTDENTFPDVKGAKVTVTDNNGYFEELTETSQGIYQTKNFLGTEGNTYQLTIYYDGKTYTAFSSVPHKVSLDTFLLAPLKLGNTDAISILPIFVDPAGKRNFYSFVRFLNNVKLKGTILMSDELSDGKMNMQPIFTSDFVLKKGDEFKLEMHNVDEAAYRYQSTKMETSQQQIAAPVNPVSNINGGALGHFSVFSSKSISVKILD